MRSTYRASGATAPFGDPSAFHGVGMEGSYWRFVAPDGAVTVVLRGDNRDADGARWDLWAIAAHPGGVLRWTTVPAPPAHQGASVPYRTATSLQAAIEDVAVDTSWTADVPWPAGRAFGGLGPAQAVPALGQYWHPHLLRGTASGTLRIGNEVRSLDGATVYAEGNWGSRFAADWWWGQAFTESATVAFAGGRLLGGAPTALVVAAEGETLRWTPPLARMAVATAPGRWRIRARTARHAVLVEAEADPAAAFVLPVPVPSERRAVLRSHQHLVGRLRVEVRRGRRLWLREETDRAGLERGRP